MKFNQNNPLHLAAVGFLIIFSLVGVQTACTKSHAAPRPAAMMFSGDCVDTGGTYTPDIVATHNATVTLNPAHFLRICNEVYVSGTISGGVNTIDTSMSSYVKISLPFASDLTLPPFNAAGQCLDLQFGELQPVAGFVGFMTTAGAGIIVNWRANRKSAYSIIYSFSYTIR